MSAPRPLVIACSGKKKPGPLSVREKYDGPLWRTFRTHGTGYHGDVWVLSALHGLLRDDALVDDYDAVIVSSRSRAFGNRIRACTLALRIRPTIREAGLVEVDFVGGAAYVETLTLAGLVVHRLNAGGIGDQRSALGAHLRAHRTLAKLSDLLPR